VVDDTYGLGTYSQLFYGVAGAPLYTGGSTNKFTQEMRASIPLGERFEWLIGGFYTDEHSPFIQNVWAEMSPQERRSEICSKQLHPADTPIRNTRDSPI